MCNERLINEMFGQLLDKSQEIISIDKDPVLKDKILSGQMGDETKALLDRWTDQTICNTVKEAKIEVNYISMIRPQSLSKFDKHYCTLRNLGAGFRGGDYLCRCSCG